MQYENTTVESPVSRIHPANVNVNHNVAIVQYIHILREGASYKNNSDGMSQNNRLLVNTHKSLVCSSLPRKTNIVPQECCKSH